MGGINAGAPSDRAYVAWKLRSEQVFSRFYAPPPPVQVEGLPQANQVEQEVPIRADLGLSDERILVQIPEDWGRVLQTDPQLAQRWRMHSRELFAHYFAQGYHAVDFVRSPNRYLLEKRQTPGGSL